MSVHLDSGDTAEGVFLFRDGELTLDGRTFPKAEIVSVAPAAQTEWRRWSGKVSLGGNLRSGNTEQADLNARVTVKRLTAENRFIADYIGNYSEALKKTTENNHRLTATWDWLFVKRLYWRIVGYEYFRDPFQNIGARSTITTALGYQIIDTARFDWEINGGPGYQTLEYEEKPTDREKREDSSAAVVDTRIDWDITSDIEFFSRYQFQKVSEAAGDQVHHGEIGLDMDLIYNFDFIKDPAPGSDGVQPENDDRTLVFSLGWDF